jgi:hypothetical protein
MKRERALFVTRRAIEFGRSVDGLSRIVTGILRDFAARGYRVLLVTDGLELGDQVFEDKTHMLQNVRNSERHVLPVSDVLALRNPFDPGPFWDAARRFNLSLENSTFLSIAGEFAGAARTAGVHHSEPTTQVFGRAA